jgi:hypothetical protein
MKFISHRGNLNGPNTAKENDIDHIVHVLVHTPYDVEIDVWLIDSLILISHDFQNKEKISTVTFDAIFSRFKNRLWVHCKNIGALSYFLKTNYNCFGHNDDSYVLTSHLDIFPQPGLVYENSITVMPELVWPDIEPVIFISKGILTDYPTKYETYYNSIRS